MFADIDAKLKILKHSIADKSTLQDEEAQLQQLLYAGEQARIASFEAISNLEQRIADDANQKRKGKGQQHREQLHAKLFQLQKQYAILEEDNDRLNFQIKEVQAKLIGIMASEREYTDIISRKRQLILDRQDWSATQLLSLETQLQSTQEVLEITRDFAYNVVRSILEQQARILGTVQPHINYSSTGIKRLLQSVDSQLKRKFDQYQVREKSLRDQIRQFIENTE